MFFDRKLINQCFPIKNNKNQYFPMEKIIPRNSNIPIIKEQTFTTNENGQTSIKIKIINS